MIPWIRLPHYDLFQVMCIVWWVLLQLQLVHLDNVFLVSSSLQTFWVKSTSFWTKIVGKPRCLFSICVSWLFCLIIFCRQPYANWHVNSLTNVYIGKFFIISTLKMIWCLLVCYCCANHCKTYFPRSSIKIFVLLHEKLNLLELRTNSCEKICVYFFM